MSKPLSICRWRADGPGAVLAALMALMIALAQGAPAGAQPIELDPEAAVETELDESEAEPEVPAAEIVDELRDAPTAGPVGLDAASEPAATRQAEAAPQRRAEPPVKRARVRPAPPPPFLVREVRVSPSAYLEPETMAAVVDAIVGTRVAIAELGSVAERFNALYDARGIALAQALIERVDPAAGLIVVELFEARVGAVRPNGRLASEAYYRKRIGVAPGDLADNRIIQANLQRFSVTDGIVADARFVPGAARGQTDLVVDFAEPQKYTFTMSADTYGTASTGMYRARFGFTDASLTGVLDPLTLTATIAESSWGGAVSYARPFNALGSRIFVSADGERSVTLGATRVTAHSLNGELGVLHAFVTEPGLRVLARASAVGFFDESILAGIRINDQAGGGAQLGVTIVGERPGLVVSYDQIVRHIVWDDRVFARTGENTTYLAGTATASARLTGAVLASVRAGWQAALGERAPTAYRTTLASPEIVRGYPTGLSAGDSFYWVRAQIEAQLPLPEQDDLALRPFAFLDHGRAYDLVAGAAVGQDALTSVGAGLAVQVADWGSAEIFVSKPLADANGFDAGDAARIDGRIALRF